MMRSLILLTALAAAYALLRGWPSDWDAVVRISLAATILVAALLFWGSPAKSPHKHARPARRPGPADLAGILMVILLVEGLILAFFTFAPARSEDLAVMMEEALDPGFTAAAATSPVDTTRSGTDSGELVISNWLFSGPGPRALNRSQKVRPSNRPEVYLYPDSPADAARLLKRERFLRNFTLATYREGQWLPHTMVPLTLTAGPDGITRPASTPGEPVSYEVTHQVNFRPQTLAITLPNFTSIALPSLRETAPDTFRLPRSSASRGNYRYRVTSVPFDFQQAKVAIPGTSPSPEYLALPENPSLRSKIKTLARSFGPPSRDSLVALRTHLRSRCRYSLDLALPENSDPVEGFLFETREGYCTHFASATVLLARAMGFPARLAFGWSGGRYFEGPNLFVFRAKEAHAWSEIFLEDLGWVIFETTPPSRNEGQSSLAPANEPPPLPDDFANDNANSADSSLAPLLRASLWTAGCAAVVLLILHLIRRSRPQPAPPLPGQSVLPDPPHYLAAFRQTCRNLGIPMPPGRTLRDHLKQIKDPPFSYDLLNYHYAVQYEGEKSDGSFEKKLLGRIRHWEKAQSQATDS